MNSTASADRIILRALMRALEEPASPEALSGNALRIAAVARHHRLSPLLSETCARTLPRTLMETFRRDRVLAAARGMLLEHVAEECVAAFRGEGIPVIVLKGLAYERRLYGTPGVRPTGDVDLLVPNRHRRAAFVALDRLGFEPRAAAPGFDDPDYHEVAWRRRDAEVDLHMSLAPTARCRIDYETIWSQRESFQVGGTEAATLSATHAAVFHGLHMAIDHFSIPAIYLVDLSRLIPDPDALARATATAAAWGCRRPLATAVALTAAFLPAWGRTVPVQPSAITSRVIAGFGSTDALPRAEQLLRKVAHFDSARQGALYLAVQAGRNVHERFENAFRKRTARERLGLRPRVNFPPATPE